MLFAGVGVDVDHAAARLHGLQAGDGFQQLLLAGAGDAGHAQDLTAAQGEAGVLEHGDAFFVFDRQMFHPQAVLGIYRSRPVDVQLHGPAHHHVGELLGIGVLGRHIADILALAQDGHPVGHVHHLVELVGDDDDGLAVGLHIAHDGEQLFRFLRGQHGGGFVQDQDIRPAVQHLDDLQGLLLGDGHIAHQLVGVHVEAVAVADLPHLAAHFLQVQPATAFQPQHDVFGRGEHVHQLEMLMDHADAQVERVVGRGDGDLFAVDEDLAAVGEVDAGEHVHQCGLAGAVFAQQGQDLALVDGQRDLVVGHDGAESLGDIFHLNSARLFQMPHPFFYVHSRGDKQKMHINMINYSTNGPRPQQRLVPGDTKKGSSGELPFLLLSSAVNGGELSSAQ